MQQSWRQDADKLTFITCVANSKPVNTAVDETQAGMVCHQEENGQLEPGVEDVPDHMIGDVNLFLYDDDDDDEEEDIKNSDQDKSVNYVVGEVEIMVARKDFQGKGYGREILLGFLWYIAKRYPGIMSEYHQANGGKRKESTIKYLRVKIDAGNRRSLKLFESVGFIKLSKKPNYFGELELRLPWSRALTEDLEAAMRAIPREVTYKRTQEA